MPLDSLHIVTEETALEEVLGEDAPAEVEIEAEGVAADTDKFSNGSIVSGTVLNVNFQQAEIDLGDGEIGVLSGRHYSAGLIVDLTGELKAGDEIEAAVLIRADHNDRVVLSRTWARSQRAWKKIMEAKKHSTIIEAVIMEEVKGGFSVVIDDALGFLPSSLVVRSELTKAASQDADSGDASEDKSNKSADAPAEQAEETTPATSRSPGEFAGQVVKCKVIEAKPDKTRYVLSHKAAVRTEQKQKEKERIAGLEKGTIVSGKVVSLEDFGAFVDIGGVRGLLHRTEMAWNHPNEPREILKMGESVFCKIIKINQQKAQVGLSLCFGENPISKVETGQRLAGKVDRLAYAGAIVALEIPDGASSPKCLLHGFVHVSEMSEYPIRRPQRVVLPGDEVAVKVIEVQRKQRRIGLSIIDAVVPDDLDDTVLDNGKPSTAIDTAPSEKVPADASDDEVAASEEIVASEADKSGEKANLEATEKESSSQEDNSEGNEEETEESSDETKQETTDNDSSQQGDTKTEDS